MKKNLSLIIILTFSCCIMVLGKTYTKDKVMEKVEPTDGRPIYYQCINPGDNCTVPENK